MLILLYGTEQEQKLGQERDQSAAESREQRQQSFPFQISLGKLHPFLELLEVCTHVALMMKQIKQGRRNRV